MARRRAVERAARRRTFTDRLLAGVVVVVAASGLMSVLPASAQVTVGRFVCRVGSLGLGACGAARVALTDPQLAPPRCATLAALDVALPEVRVVETTTPAGLRVETRTARSGDSVLRLGPAVPEDPPFLLQGGSRGWRTVLPGVEVQDSSAWFLGGGQGADAVVDAAAEQHRQWQQRRSSLAPLAAVFRSRGRDLPEPTLLFSQVRPARPVLPPPASTAGPPRAADRVAVRLDRPSVLRTNRVTRDSTLTVPVSGAVAGRSVSGAASWRRAGSGAVQAVLVAVVSDGRLARGEPPMPPGAAEVAYATIPIATEVERALVERWLTDPAGFTLPLPELLGLRKPDVRDQLATFLTRAATVTVLRFAGTTPSALTDDVSAQLVQGQRIDRPERRLLDAFAVAPQPTGAPRTLTSEPACRST